jgi:hypothetical protein
MSASADSSGECTAVHLLQLPVPLAARAQEHFRELTREFTLMVTGTDGPPESTPVRLLQLVDVLTRQFAGINSAAEERLDAAIVHGQPVIDDHVLLLPAQAGPAVSALGDLMDEADEFCRAGRHLLTLETPPDCVTYRHWYLGNVVDQLAGKPAVPWPQDRI